MFLQATKSLVRLKLNATSSRHNSSPLSHIRVSLLYISVYRLSNTNLYHFELDVPTWLHNVMICRSVDPCFPDTRSNFIMANVWSCIDYTDYTISGLVHLSVVCPNSNTWGLVGEKRGIDVS